MLLAAPLERSLPSAGICSAEKQGGMEGMEGGERKDISDSRHGWREQTGGKEVVGGGFEKFVFFFSDT